MMMMEVTKGKMKKMKEKFEEENENNINGRKET